MRSVEALEHLGRQLAGSLAEELEEHDRLTTLGVAGSWLPVGLAWAGEDEELSVDSAGVVHQPGCSRVSAALWGEDGEGVEATPVACTPLGAVYAGYEIRRCCFPEAVAFRSWCGTHLFDARRVARLTEVAAQGRAVTGFALLNQLASLLAERIVVESARTEVAEAYEHALAVCGEGCAADEVSVLADLGCPARGEPRRAVGGVLPPRAEHGGTQCSLVILPCPPHSPAELGCVLAGEVVCERAGYTAVVLPDHVRAEVVLPGASVRVPRDLDAQRVALALELLAGEDGALSGGRLRRALRSAGEALS